MIDITIAKNAGFCFGVKRAIDEVQKLLDNNIKLYCIGDIIHNEYVIDKLKSKGLIIINEENEISKIHDEYVVIRSHGIEKNVLDTLKINNNTILDLTCPYVKKIHDIVDTNTTNGETTILVGDKNHPEVKGIRSYAKGEIYIINSPEEAKTLTFYKDKKYIIVSQTTSSTQNYQNIIDILHKIPYNIRVYDTICKSTENRQNEAMLLAKCSDVVLVVGSKNSSNTKKLYEIASDITKTYYIENKNDLDAIDINDKSKVAILAGASAPLDLIEEISNYARSKF